MFQQGYLYPLVGEMAVLRGMEPSQSDRDVLIQEAIERRYGQYIAGFHSAILGKVIFEMTLTHLKQVNEIFCTWRAAYRKRLTEFINNLDDDDGPVENWTDTTWISVLQELWGVQLIHVARCDEEQQVDNFSKFY